MRALLLPLLIFAAFPLLADTVIVTSYSASGYMDRKQYVFEASKEEIARTPVWKPDAEFPPLSARKAQDIARREMQELLGSGKEPWLLRDTTIADMGDGMHFAYVIQFEQPAPQGCIGCDFMRVLVLMDGTVPKPIVTSM